MMEHIENGESWPMSRSNLNTTSQESEGRAFSASRAGLFPPALSVSAGASPITSETVRPVPGQPQLLAGVCDDLGAAVATPVKEKIWRGEFVDLGALIKLSVNAGSPNDEGLLLTLSPSNANLQLRATNRNPVIKSIYQWTSAMLISVSI